MREIREGNEDTFKLAKYLVLKPEGLLWVLDETGLTEHEGVIINEMWLKENIAELIV